MISLSALAELAQEYQGDLGRPVAVVTVGAKAFDMNARPAVMGCINLSRDSVYRDSIAVSLESAVRRGSVLAAQGADVVDLGAESSTATASRVAPDEQVAAMVPVVERLSALDVPVSVETYHPEVARECLKAGAQMINYSGGIPRDRAMFDTVAEFDATLLLCFIPGSDARDRRGLGDTRDLIPMVYDHFAERVSVARACGVQDIILDPGIGFPFDASASPLERIQQQARTLLHTFRLRALGLPVCQSLPNAFELFEDQFRTAEGFFAALAFLGGCGMFRTHEVSQVVRVLGALDVLTVR